MAKKENKMTPETILAVEELLLKLHSIDGVTTKKMFGGHGIFHDNKMFGLIDSKGVSFLKADDTTRPDFEKLGSVQHSRMPYYSIPYEVINDKKKLTTWVGLSIPLSKK